MTQPELVAAAAQLVVEEGLDFHAAKRKALRRLGMPERAPLPSNEELDAAVREHIALFHADTQPHELAALRQIALGWMRRLQAFQPHLSGAVWQGTATWHSDIHLQLFCEDTKSAEIELINQGQPYEAHTLRGFHGGEVDVLTLITTPPRELDPTAQRRGVGAADIGAPATHTGRVLVHLAIHDLDDLRGALKADAKGRVPRGNLEAVSTLVRQHLEAPPATHA
jgi:hypothetical protein